MEDKRSFVFIDASNLFYGGEKNLGWKIDYQTLFNYLKDKYKISKVFYFGGVEIYDFHFDYLKNDAVPLRELEKHLSDTIKQTGEKTDEAFLLLLGQHLQRIRFYLKLEKFGY